MYTELCLYERSRITSNIFDITDVSPPSKTPPPTSDAATTAVVVVVFVKSVVVVDVGADVCLP